MRYRLAYGKTGLEFELPDDLNASVVESNYVAGPAEPARAIADALRSPIGSRPLHDRVRPTDKVGIVFSDITRPTPNDLILPVILQELAHVPVENITLFNALGTHRRNTEGELRAMLGSDLVDRWRIVQNDAFHPETQVHTGVTSRGHDVWLNRELMECDVKVLTGFIEPHFFAGFSGGGKALMPGMAGERTVLGNHDAAMIADPRSTWGVTEGNPIWEEIQEAARTAGETFLVNVTLNREKAITGVFAGDLGQAHKQGCEFARATAMVAVPHRFDIVITGNSGYPLDLNLYQAVKGMSAGALVVKESGAIVVAADCWDGIPEHGLYGQLLRQANSPQELLDSICTAGTVRQDQWQAQIQAQIQLKADVYVRSDHLTDAQIESALLRPCSRIEQTVEELISEFGPNATICVLPEGPQIVPYVRPN
ncbi:MAG: nickel-dependent lactate racemase [Chloroflexi bacterium]|nr:nickel-dependent lactate racemase [Chloroflexota bacterium]